MQNNSNPTTSSIVTEMAKTIMRNGMINDLITSIINNHTNTNNNNDKNSSSHMGKAIGTINVMERQNGSTQTTASSWNSLHVMLRAAIIYATIVWSAAILICCLYCCVLPLWFRCSRKQQYAQLFPRSPLGQRTGSGANGSGVVVSRRLRKPRAFAATRELYINAGGAQLGVWHIAAHAFCCRDCRRRTTALGSRAETQAGPCSGPLPQIANTNPFSHGPEIVLLYAHSNAGTRANGQTLFYALGTALMYDTVTFDYRGYADSTDQQPTAGTMTEDLDIVYRWILSQGVPPNRVLMWGHSIGTAVIVRLLESLPEDQTPLAAVLEAPFTSLADALQDYPPLQLLRRFASCWFRALITDPITANEHFQFNSLQSLSGVSCPLLILHSRDDWVVPVRHAKRLYDQAKEVQSPAQVAARTTFHMFAPEKRHGHNGIQCDRRLPAIVERFVRRCSLPLSQTVSTVPVVDASAQQQQQPQAVSLTNAAKRNNKNNGTRAKVIKSKSSLNGGNVMRAKSVLPISGIHF